MMNGKLGLCSADVTGDKKHPQAKNAASKRLRFSFYVAAPCSRKIGKSPSSSTFCCANMLIRQFYPAKTILLYGRSPFLHSKGLAQ